MEVEVLEGFEIRLQAGAGGTIGTCDCEDGMDDRVGLRIHCDLLLGR